MLFYFVQCFLIFFFFGVSCFRSSCLCVCGVAGGDEVGVATIIGLTIIGLFGGLLSVIIGLTTPTPTVPVTTTTNDIDNCFEREREGEEGSEIKGATAPNTTNFNCDFGFEREEGIELAVVKS